MLVPVFYSPCVNHRLTSVNVNLTLTIGRGLSSCYMHRPTDDKSDACERGGRSLFPRPPGKGSAYGLVDIAVRRTVAATVGA